ncbi:MAG: DUF2917 domain-containing protein [Casimicrobiaceae bacterium]
MTIKLAFGTTLLDAGRTMVVPAGQRGTLRVHDGLVWATSSGDLDDVWLRAGQEHRLQSHGMTVIESTSRSTIELIPPCANDEPSPPTLAWLRMPAWLDDVGALLALVAIVGVMLIAGFQVAFAGNVTPTFQDAHPSPIPNVPATTAGLTQRRAPTVAWRGRGATSTHSRRG